MKRKKSRTKKTARKTKTKRKSMSKKSLKKVRGGLGKKLGAPWSH